MTEEGKATSYSLVEASAGDDCGSVFCDDGNHPPCSVARMFVGHTDLPRSRLVSTAKFEAKRCEVGSVLLLQSSHVSAFVSRILMGTKVCGLVVVKVQDLSVKKSSVLDAPENTEILQCVYENTIKKCETSMALQTFFQSHNELFEDVFINQMLCDYPIIPTST